MTDFSQTASAAMAASPGLARVAGYCAYVSGVVSIFGIVFLLAFFGGLGGRFGTLNDVAVIVQYVLMLPIALALLRYLRADGGRLSQIAFVVGLVGILTVIALQSMLVAKLIPFEVYIGIVSAGFLVATVWFVLNGIVGRASGKLTTGWLLDVLAGLYFGYPVWAFRMGRALLGA